jgi:four helix bundle protein
MPHPESPEYKFQKLDVYQLGLDFVDKIYQLTSQLPESERFNLRSQLERAATSIVLNIAEGSTGQTNMEQNRFLGMALRSYIETIACMDLIVRRKYLKVETLDSARQLGHQVFVKLQALRRALKNRRISGPQA